MTSTEPTQRPSAAATILVAEDNPDSRDALRALLEAYGYRVEEARNGEEAVALALSGTPDLVLMDIMMPIKDGLQATREIRSSPAGSGLPIVALTAMAGSRQLAMEAGCDDYLAKPIDVPVFLATIHSWLQKRMGA